MKRHPAYRVTAEAAAFLREHLPPEEFRKLTVVSAAEMQADDGFILTSADLAEALGYKTASSIRQKVQKLEAEGLAEKYGRDWMFRPEAVEFLKKKQTENR